MAKALSTSQYGLTTDGLKAFKTLDRITANVVSRQWRIDLTPGGLDLQVVRGVTFMKASPGKQKHDREREMTPALIHALNHPTRRQILRLLDAPDLEMSPSEMADSIQVGLSALSFHAKVLLEIEATRCTRTRQVRGTFESFYASNVCGNELVAAILARTASDDDS